MDEIVDVDDVERKLPSNWPRPEIDFEELTEREALSIWASKLDAVSQASEKVLQFAEDTPKQIMQGPTRAYWRAVETAVSAYLLLVRRGIAPEPLPLVLMTSFRLLAGTLAVGIVPDAVSYAAAAGTASPSPRARDNIAYGIAYVLAAKAGWINDRAPVKRVAASFKVSEATVRNWVANSSSYPPFLPIPADGYSLAEKMLREGERYSLSERKKGGGRKPAL
ncbi:hypothetical protein [Rhizobium sp. L245/93]|uniref:hypothetical protein n=1 Tax=Rhizobium sp. L245/93 TaxID=2819998 RepID=UPI001ADA115F|nr:hypothetical protein [Rhizobium sp. L245/93]MBO9168427.1 hypothetical protein [Rhizobium sp. L245/93]